MQTWTSCSRLTPLMHTLLGFNGPGRICSLSLSNPAHSRMRAGKFETRRRRKAPQSSTSSDPSVCNSLYVTQGFRTRACLALHAFYLAGEHRIAKRGRRTPLSPENRPRLLDRITVSMLACHASRGRSEFHSPSGSFVFGFHRSSGVAWMCG
jgi:hypothetical protein